MDTKALAQFHSNEVVRNAVKALFEDVANRIALKHMDNGEDVSYVPRNKEIYKAMERELDQMFKDKGEDKKPQPRSV